ncbi:MULTISPECIES: diguanylate cyclase domain-containing protein [Pseudoalteromonas]|uniref:diguanylate cyclase domain-containing protein n=1 Tax=Pseudoalteromonas TaxID=53246 RepID=UPI0002F9BF6A|nr:MULTISPECIES: diguanylate cyclase [Pseudoalteromonas]MCF6143841.1 hypothetical protein [Pseudoalteromonas mariniglutinosa NCIMB 1770]
MDNHLTLHFITSEMLNAPVISAQYDGYLVLASILTAVFASYISFLLSARIKGSQLKEETRLWTIVASCFLGGGIWAMHFIGMLAYKLPIPVEYDITITLVSIFPSIFASYIVMSPTLGRFNNLWLRSILMGLGIGSMHYIGMMAMRMPAHMAYEPWLFSFSVLVAVVLSGLALKINELRLSTHTKLYWVNLLAALTMGTAISGMHYIGMMSMYVFAAHHTTYITNENSAELAQVILFVLLALSLFLVGGMELRARSLLSAKLKAVLNTVQDAVICFDKQGNIEFANPATTSIFGFEQHELIGKNIAPLIPQKYATQTTHYNDAEQAGKSQLLQGRNNKGADFPITVSISPIRKHANPSFVATIKDLTNIQNQEAFTQTIFDTLPIMLVVKEAEQLSFSHINKAGEQLLGKTRDELIGLSDFDIFPEQEAECFTASDRSVLSSGEGITIDEEPITIDGQTHYLRTRKMAIKDSQGKTKFLLAVAEDITELRVAKLELEKLHHRMSIAANAAHIGVWEWNFKTNELIWDEWMFALYGVDKSAFTSNYTEWEKRVHPDDFKNVIKNLKSAVANKGEFHAEFQIMLPSGETRYLNADGQIYGDCMVGINFDISKRVIAENKILQLAQTDHLTGLANRNALCKFAEHAFDCTKRTATKVACLYFDLDKFKPINDTHGHLIGDLVLVEIAKRLSDIARKTDCIARIGGDEFVILITHIEENNQVKTALARFIAAIELPIMSSQGSLCVGASIGYAIYPDEGESLDELLNKADARMYNHKRAKDVKQQVIINQ